MRELGGADSKSELTLLKLGPQNPIWGEKVKVRKSQSYQFCLKIGTNGIWRILILIPTLVFRICNHKAIFGQIWRTSLQLSVLTEKWHTEHLEDTDSYFVISFLNFLPEIYFWANLGWKSQSCLFCLKVPIRSISRMLIPILVLVFLNFKPKSRVCWFLFWD